MEPIIKEMSTDLVVVEKLDVVQVFTKDGGSESLIEQIERLVRTAERDISTDKGRKAIASLAYKIAKTKTYLDETGKELTADIKKQISLVDGERKRIRDRLDTLKEEVRKPLTDWEEVEKLRVETHERNVEAIGMLVNGIDANTSQDGIMGRLDQLGKYKDMAWEEFTMRAEQKISGVDFVLRSAFEARVKYDADQAELAKLREAETARLQKERDDKIAAEAAEKAKKEAEDKAAREKKEAEEKAEADRKAAEAREAAAEQARKDAEERAAKAEQDAKDAAAKAEADRVAAAAKAEADKKAAAEAAAQEERDRQARDTKAKADEDAKRAADLEHTKKINNEALEAIVKVMGEAHHALRQPESNATVIGKALVIAIAKGSIPHISIKY